MIPQFIVYSSVIGEEDKKGEEEKEIASQRCSIVRF